MFGIQAILVGLMVAEFTLIIEKDIRSQFSHLIILKSHSKERAEKKCKSQKIEQFTVRLCLLGKSAAIPINSHQHDYLNIV